MASETQLYLQDVHRSFDGFKAINGLSMAIAKGELRAVVGPNGAGKTTMLDIITGKTRPDQGRVVWDEDTDLTRLDEADTARLGIGRKFQKPTVVRDAERRDEPDAGARRQARRGGDASSTGSRAARRGGSPSSSNSCGLDEARARLAGGLSHGQKQWLEIGMLLAQDPQLLLVDEPAAGMTDAETMRTAELLRSGRGPAFGARHRARHGVRAGARLQGDGAAPGLGAGRGVARPRLGQSRGDRGLSGALTC